MHSDGVRGVIIPNKKEPNLLKFRFFLFGKVSPIKPMAAASMWRVSLPYDWDFSSNTFLPHLLLQKTNVPTSESR